MKNSLVPFSLTNNTKEISVETNFLFLSNNSWTVEFSVKGSINKILWPAETASKKSRSDELWKSTCFEFFFSSEKNNETPYTEINCSPNSNWNAYSFSGYREGMKLNTDIQVNLKNNTQPQAENHLTKFTVEIKSTTPMDARTYAPTMVIEFTDGEKSYWATSHPSPQPDFHNKKTWNTLETK
ncbi:MAG: DOMON-like domain-containing protein [Bdellovibrio sp.]